MFGIVLLLAAIIVSAVRFAQELPRGSGFTVQDWSWLIALGVELGAAAIVSLYFYRLGSALPTRIHDELHRLAEGLQSTLLGYDEVTKKIISVCDSAQHSYCAATLMPVIGAVGQEDDYLTYKSTLLHKIHSGLTVELVFLDDEPLQDFMEHALLGRGDPDRDRRIAMVNDFVHRQLPPCATDPDLAGLFTYHRVDSLPYQICIADGQRAVLYFASAQGMAEREEIRGLYTENRAVIDVLRSGFRQMQQACKNQTTSRTKEEPTQQSEARTEPTE
jgi:hypothetical protein